MAMTHRILSRLLIAGLLLIALATNFAYAGNGNHGAPGPIVGTGLDTLLLIAGAGGIYWMMRWNRRKTISVSR